MKGIVSDKNKKLFAGTGFKILQGGEQVNVSLEEFENNPRKYVNSGIGHMYENKAELKEWVAKNPLTVKKADPVKLDMAKAKTRGTTFAKGAEGKKAMSEDVAKLLKEQDARRARVKKQFLANQAKAKKSSSTTSSAAQKAKEAAAKKQAALKAKKDAEKK